MSEGKTIAERLPRLLVELEDAFEVERDDPRRFALWKMRNAAGAALDAGMRTAAEIIEAARAMQAAATSQSEGRSDG